MRRMPGSLRSALGNLSRNAPNPIKHSYPVHSSTRRSSHQSSSFDPPEEDTWQVYSALFSRFLLAVGMVHCFTEYVAEITLCEGPSMYPTLHPAGEIVLIDKWTLRRMHRSTAVDNDKSALDDVSIIHDGHERVRRARKKQQHFEQQFPQNNNTNDTIPTWHEPRISVSDIPPTWSMLWQLVTTPLSIGDVVVLQHPHRTGTVCKRVVGLPGDTVLRPRQGLLVIPNGHVWVEGDNPANSSDSRNYGTVPMALIQGRVVGRVWPLRGQALMVRGGPPRNETNNNKGPMGYTILPAGYEGQHIVKTSYPEEEEEEDL